MGTPHNKAEKGQIAKVVLMPGDPLRAKYIAETYLENPVQFNDVRNMFGYTGLYKGKEVSVMGSGMGMPSVGIYSYELFSQYDVETIIRIGSAGGYSDEVQVYDVFVVDAAWSESTYALVQSGYDKDIIYPNKELTDTIISVAGELDIPVVTGITHSSDVFYRHAEPNYWERLRADHGCITVEMESFALFHNANVLGKKAACILTVSDSLVTHTATTAEERQNSFTKMMEIALETAIK
jgi:purine-nucleoside phosphorylase, family 1 (deoD)